MSKDNFHWLSIIGLSPAALAKVTAEGNGDDDWETDPDFVNDVSEQEQRWGSKTIEGSGRTAGSIKYDQSNYCL